MHMASRTFSRSLIVTVNLEAATAGSFPSLPVAGGVDSAGSLLGCFAQMCMAQFCEAQSIAAASQSGPDVQGQLGTPATGSGTKAQSERPTKASAPPAVDFSLAMLSLVPIPPAPQVQADPAAPEPAVSAAGSSAARSASGLGRDAQCSSLSPVSVMPASSTRPTDANSTSAAAPAVAFDSTAMCTSTEEFVSVPGPLDLCSHETDPVPVPSPVSGRNTPNAGVKSDSVAGESNAEAAEPSGAGDETVALSPPVQQASPQKEPIPAAAQEEQAIAGVVAGGVQSPTSSETASTRPAVDLTQIPTSTPTPNPVRPNAPGASEPESGNVQGTKRPQSVAPTRMTGAEIQMEKLRDLAPGVQASLHAQFAVSSIGTANRDAVAAVAATDRRFRPTGKTQQVSVQSSVTDCSADQTNPPSHSGLIEPFLGAANGFPTQADGGAPNASTAAVSSPQPLSPASSVRVVAKESSSGNSNDQAGGNVAAGCSGMIDVLAASPSVVVTSATPAGHATQIPISDAASTGPARNESGNPPVAALHAATAAPAAASPIHLARMADNAARSEMRIGLNTAEFGSVQVRTVVRASDVGILIGSEKGDLRSLLANDLPGIAHNLQQKDLRLTQVSFQQNGLPMSGDSPSQHDSQSRAFSYKAQPTAATPPESAAMERVSSTEVGAIGAQSLSVLA